MASPDQMAKFAKMRPRAGPAWLDAESKDGPRMNVVDQTGWQTSKIGG